MDNIAAYSNIWIEVDIATKSMKLKSLKTKFDLFLFQ